MLSLLALSLSAQAATNEISLEIGWIGAYDPAWDFFSSGDTLPSYGLRVGFAVHPNVAVIAGWQHAIHGARISGPSLDSEVYYEEEDDYYEDSSDFGAAMYTDQISVGAKADVELFKWLHPYVSAQIVGMRGLARLDDDDSDDENLTQVQAVGLTGGFTGAGGLEFPIGADGRWAIAPYIELGYGWMAPMQLAELGSVQFGGFAGRTGVGVRF